MSEPRDDRAPEESSSRPARPGGDEAEEHLDLSEKGGMRGGERQTSDRRLYMQLVAFGGCDDTGPVLRTLQESQLDAAVYADVGDPRGIGVLTISESPDTFVGPVREMMAAPPFAGLRQKHEMTMFGRTYAIGYEPDLDAALIERPRSNALNPAWPWAVWYPLRRSGAFARLSDEDQRRILGEHGRIGIAFGRADLAHDVRLACFGLDRDDNDFVIGLVGGDLHPLSYVVQRMRSTEQTSLYIEKLGPFFVGKALWMSGAGELAARHV